MPSSFDHKLSQYEPVDDSFSSKELERSYWLVTHKTVLRNLAIAVLLAIDILLLGYGLTGFATYFITGQPREEALVRAIAQRLGVSHAEQLKSAAAAPLTFGDGGVRVFDAGDDRFDFITEVQNPNQSWYVLLTYHYEIPEQEPTASRTIFVLPGEKKFLTILGEKRTGQTVNDATLKITNELWSRIDPHEVADVPAFLAARVAFEIIQPAYAAAGHGTEAGVAEESGNRITFTIKNNSAHNFWAVPVQIALMRSGSLEGIEEVQVRELKTGESRVVDVRNYVKNQFVDDVIVTASVDIFDPSVYMQQ